MVRGECAYHPLQPLCGAPIHSRGGAPCERLAGECPYHAPSAQRCQSTIDGAPERSCYNCKAEGEDYCIYHYEFPHIGRNLRDCATERLAAGRPVLYTEFLRQYYPDALGKMRGPDVRGWRRLAAYFTGAAPENFFPDV